MSTPFSSYRVDVLIGTEVHSFFTPDAPTYESERTDNGLNLFFVCLVPENGTSRGKKCRFPLDRVISVNDD